MTALRHYVGLVVATCVALAVGIALGAGPLQGSTPVSDQSLSKDKAALADTVVSLEAGQTFGSAVSRVAAPSLLKGRLTNSSVAVFALPGVPDSTISGVSSAVQQAGGTVLVTARLSADLIDPHRKTYVDSLSTSAIKGLRDVHPTGAGPYARFGALLARAYTGHSSSLRFDAEAIRIHDQIQGAKLSSVASTPARRASLVIVLASGDHGTGQDTTARDVIETYLVTALAHGSQALLVAAPANASLPGGLLTAVHATPGLRHHVSTLNVVDSVPGQIAAVYALAGAANGTYGDYGTVQAGVAMPPGLG